MFISSSKPCFSRRFQHLHSVRGKSPAGHPCLCSSGALCWTPHRDDGGNCWQHETGLLREAWLCDCVIYVEVCVCSVWIKTNETGKKGCHRDRLTHLNWQKMSAYSGGMLLACRTVTRKVKILPTSRCSAKLSPGFVSTFPSFKSFRHKTHSLILDFVNGSLNS